MDNRMAREIVYKNTPALFLGIMMILSGLVMTVIRSFERFLTLWM